MNFLAISALNQNKNLFAFVIDIINFACTGVETNIFRLIDFTKRTSKEELNL